MNGTSANGIQHIETLERRTDGTEFMAIAKAVDADAVELFPQYGLGYCLNDVSK